MTARTDEHRFTKKHIFVVNGDPQFLELARELLQLEAFNVTTTNFVPQTYDQIEALTPDLIIVDLTIGEQAGWDLLERLQDEVLTHDIPVIVTSTDPRFLDVAYRNQSRYGGDRYIAKPMDVQDLVDTVQNLVGKV